MNHPLETELAAKHGLRIRHTGGGVMAWSKDVDGFEILICADDEDGGLGDETTAKWGCSVWTKDGDELACESFDTIAEAVTFGEKFAERTAAERGAEPDRASIQTKIRLAREFGAKLGEDLTRGEMRETIDRNKSQANDLICHSHDFCDANMVMADAFQTVMGREIDMDDDTDLALWNEAWAIAKAADYFI